ncbi:MAG: hypothetical protein A2X12_11040 [Bacteroidetes bacterium GWE2_29_8]|nr:MAG: hypothetical protein A2X12_11040 [Bacteroidetes bacterium GWE2_29_8]OFY22828.1 MAG: hypothetical protein A2X02_07085 [Bacteroidetes bacterium GWF2_29_10]
MKKICLLVLVILFSVVHVSAQLNKSETKSRARILFIFDASYSMYGRWQTGTKMDIAKKMLTNFLDSLRIDENIEIGLRVYGHQSRVPPQDCNDTKLEVPIAKNNISAIKRKLKIIEPKGTTPIARSLEAAGDDFSPCDNCRNIIILITDGIEECNGDPCAVSAALQKKGIILKPFIIGIGENFANKFECVGRYFDATNEASFKTVLNIVVSQALNSTTAQVNLLDNQHRASETNVNVTFYDNFNGRISYDFIHTLNSAGFPDTLLIDPLPEYTVVAHTLPPVSNDSVKIIPGKHNVIPISAPQGYLVVKMKGGSAGNLNIQYLVKQFQKPEIINVQNINQKEKYILGLYDIEVLTLPRIKINEIQIMQSHTTTVEIPQPGQVTFNLNSIGYGGIYLEESNKLELVYNFKENITKESLLLQPGNYRAVYRAKTASETKFSVEKQFKIESGQSININMY